MAVLVSIARGHSACYQFTTVGAADGATITGERGVGYYLSAVEKVGEPRLDLGRQRRRRAWLPRQGHGAREDFAVLLHDREHTLRDAELGTLRGLARTVRHAAPMRSHAQARAEIHARASGGGPGGSPRTANSRMRKNAPPWLQAWRRRRRHVRRGLARTWCTPLSRTCPTTRTARTRTPRARQLAPGEQAEHLPGPEGKRYATPRSCPSDSNCSPTRTQKARRSLRTNRPPRCSASASAGPIPHAIGDLIMALAFTRAMVLAVASTAAY